MRIYSPLVALLAALVVAPCFISAQISPLASEIEKAKNLSSMTGRPMLAVAGEAAN